MSHIVGKEAYKSFEERINRFPQGAPPSETFYKLLGVLVNEKEAAYLAQLPIKYFSVKTASRIWKTDEVSAQKILDNLASRALLIDAEAPDGEHKYMLPPPMAGFLEFSMMRVRDDLDQHLLGELFYQYMNVEEDFVKQLFYSTETKLGRVFVQEGVLSNDNLVNILDFEKASHIIQTSEYMGVSMCYCRHKMQHVGKACDAPMDICMTFGNAAASLIRNNYARRVDAVEGMELLHKAWEHNLVQCGENVREGVTFICNCCGCCCEALVAAKKFGMMHPVETTNFIPDICEDDCTKCGKCVRTCPINAIEYVDKEMANGEKVKSVRVNEEICLGCGVCARSCPKSAIKLKSRPTKIITPANSVHRCVLMAIEKGQLQNLIFDNQAFASHRAMAAVLGAILKLPPVKRAMASKQMKSVYLDRLLQKMDI